MRAKTQHVLEKNFRFLREKVGFGTVIARTPTLWESDLIRPLRYYQYTLIIVIVQGSC